MEPVEERYERAEQFIADAGASESVLSGGVFRDKPAAPVRLKHLPNGRIRIQNLLHSLMKAGIFFKNPHGAGPQGDGMMPEFGG